MKIIINTRKIEEYTKRFRFKVDKETLLLIIEIFSEYLIEVVMDLVYEASQSKRYESGWEPKREEGYKEYLGVDPKGNILDYMKDSLIWKRAGYNIIISIDPAKKYPDTQIPIERVLRAIEYGTSDFNARPIIMKQFRFVQTHLKNLWDGFLCQKGVC